MPTTVVMARNRRRRPRGGILRWVLLGAALLLLLALALYFITSFPRDVGKLSYPLDYEAQIRREAAVYGLDPARVAAVIYCESSFRPDVISSADARGLMQIMPTTGQWIAGKFSDIGNYTQDMLFDPDVNIRLGCWYLDYLDGLFGGDLTTATAAYHQGPGQTAKWLEDPQYSSDGLTLTAIPSEVTGTYVKRVKLAYEHYKELLANES